MELIFAIHSACQDARVKLVIGLVCVRPPEAATVEEFKAVLSRDLHLDESLVLVLHTPPTSDQVQLSVLDQHAYALVKGTCSKTACRQWLRWCRESVCALAEGQAAAPFARSFWTGLRVVATQGVPAGTTGVVSGRRPAATDPQEHQGRSFARDDKELVCFGLLQYRESTTAAQSIYVMLSIATLGDGCIVVSSGLSKRVSACLHGQECELSLRHRSAFVVHLILCSRRVPCTAVALFLRMQASCKSKV
jgi:hypothetical protein